MLDHNKLYGRMLVFTLAASAVFSSQCFAAADRTLAEYAEIGTAVLRHPAKMAHTYTYATNHPRQKLAHVLSYTLCIVNDSLSIYNHRGSKSLYHEYTRLAHDLLSGAQAVSAMLNNDILVDGASDQEQGLSEISKLHEILAIIESASAMFVACTNNLTLAFSEDAIKRHQLAAGLTSLAHYWGEYLRTSDSPIMGYTRLALLPETVGLMVYQQLSLTERQKFQSDINRVAWLTTEQFVKFSDENTIKSYTRKVEEIQKNSNENIKIVRQKIEQAENVDFINRCLKNIFLDIDPMPPLEQVLKSQDLTKKSLVCLALSKYNFEMGLKTEIFNASEPLIKELLQVLKDASKKERELIIDLLTQAQKA